MKRAFVPITRHFRVLKDDDVSDTWSKRIRGLRSDGPTWKELLADQKTRATVLISPSGAGKTEELTKQLVPSLRTQRQHIVYTTARSFMEHGLGGLDADEGRAAANWRAAGSPALLLVVDAVDELNLTHHRFVDVTRRLLRELDQAAARVRLLFGVRTGGWKTSFNAALIDYLTRTAEEGATAAAEQIKLVAFDALSVERPNKTILEGS